MPRSLAWSKATSPGHVVTATRQPRLYNDARIPTSPNATLRTRCLGGPGRSTRTGGPRPDASKAAESLSETVAYPDCDIPDTIVQRTTEECGRSAAWRRADERFRSICAAAAADAQNRQKLPFSPRATALISAAGRLTISAAEDYIDPLGRAAASAMARLRSPSLFTR